MRRVVVTGAAGISPLGSDWDQIESKLRAGTSGITPAPLYDEYPGIRAKSAGIAELGELPARYDRRQLRTMSRSALLAVRASELALADAGLLDDPEIARGRVGVAYGSCIGSPETLMRLGQAWQTRNTKGILASSYVQVMSHCCASGISLFFQLRGRMIPTCSACTSGSQAIGYSYESIRHGYQDVMLAGGAEELCAGLTGLFEAVGAASSSQDNSAPRPFDISRDGLVVSEGAGTLVLEDLEHARARGATIYAEVVGFGTNSDGTHMTNPAAEFMQVVMNLSLEDAGISASDIGFVHAHATGTEIGDMTESCATQAVFGSQVPITATKSYQGHTLGATGALEAWYSIQMMRRGWLAPILGLEQVDPRCAELDYVRGGGRAIAAEHVMVNNFAFGGVNTSLVFRRWER